MKRIFLFAFLVFAGQGFLRAQSVEITPFGGYVVPANWGGPYGNLHFKGAAQYGGIISIAASRVVDLELIYNRIDSKVEAEIYNSGYYLPSYEEFDVSQNYYMIGFNKNFRIKEKISPFVGMSIGGVYMSPKTEDYYSNWFFAMGIDGGVKVYFNDVIGLRLQAQLMMPLQYGGFSFYYGSGGGGSSMYVNSTIVEFGFTGGLVFRVGKK